MGGEDRRETGGKGQEGGEAEGEEERGRTDEPEGAEGEAWGGGGGILGENMASMSSEKDCSRALSRRDLLHTLQLGIYWMPWTWHEKRQGSDPSGGSRVMGSA